MNPQSSIRGLSLLRLVIGASSWLTPRLAGRAFLLHPDDNPQAPYLARLFGVRDVALGWGLTSTRGEARRSWIVAGIACDVADTLAALAGGRAGYLSRTQTVLLATPAMAATALGVVALSEGEESPGAVAGG